MTKLIYALALALTTVACSAPATIHSDYSGLGTSPLAKLISTSLHNEPETTERAIGALVNSLPDRSEVPPKEDLERLGFHCDTGSTFCRYQGSARSKLVMPDGTVQPRNDLTFKYDVTVDTSKKPYAITLKTSKESKE
jgi:hypothetical protein